MPQRNLKVIAKLRLYSRHILLLLFFYVSSLSFALAESQISNSPGDLDSPQCGTQLSDEVIVASELCLSLVYQGAPLVKPRQMIQWTDRYFLISDMGGWVSGKGVIWLFDRNNSQFRSLISGLSLPHGLVRFGKDQLIIGERHQVTRIRLDASFSVSEQQVLISRNDFGSHKHPLSAFVLDADNNLILNIGAPTDQCREALENSVCNDRNEFAQVRRYFYAENKDRWSADYQVLGYGLRNSMALAVHDSGVILQAENGMDFDRVHSPFETINKLDINKDFGWPYCHSDLQSNILWQEHQSCQGFDAPLALLPPHGAPLSMIYYQGDLMPSLSGKLIVPLHSYQKPGHRVLAVTVDINGLPIINPEQQYQYSTTGGYQKYRSFPNNMGADFEYLISDRTVKKSLSVAGIIEAFDGSIYMLDDINKSILQLKPR